MRTAIVIAVLSVVFAVGAIVFVLERESDKNADPNRVVHTVDPPDADIPGRGG